MMHGTNNGYRGGCRCAACHRAFRNRQNRLRRERKKNGGLVSSARAMDHLRSLAAQGIGLPTVFQVTGISTETLFHVKHGVRPRIRKSTEKAILAVGIQHRRRFTERKPVQKMIDTLLAEGFTPTALVRRLGYSNTTALNLDKYVRVTQEKAKRIAAFYDVIMAGGDEEERQVA